MAATSTAHTATTLTPPSSSHGDGDGGGGSRDLTSVTTKDQASDKNQAPQDENPTGACKPPSLSRDEVTPAFPFSQAPDGADQVCGPKTQSYSNEKDELDDRPENVVDEPFEEEYGRNEYPQKRSQEDMIYSEEDSKWIHRDKLAKIESEELQSAGLVLPRSRPQSRFGGDRTQSSMNRTDQEPSTRSRKVDLGLETSTPESGDAAAVSDWDLRAVEMELDADTPVKASGGSRIPVPKKNSIPISTQYLDRDRLGKRENTPEEQDKRVDGPKPRPRSNSIPLKSIEPSPNVKAQPAKRPTVDTSSQRLTPTGPRKAMAPRKTIPPEARGKVKTRKNGTSGSARPSTRSGARGVSVGSARSKPMEGDPPWLISAFKPDPRLPPDQQLLPIVARRLQQEKWEQEGKFGSIYDKDFRPLTDKGFLTPPANMPSSSSDNTVRQEEEQPVEDWPLKSPDIPKSPVSPARSSSYSTMPKIQDRPPTSPLASPRTPAQSITHPAEPMPTTRVPDVADTREKRTTKKEKGGCGCCIIM